MARAKVFVFAPADRRGESYKRMEELGCDLSYGSAGWMTPRGNNEEEMCALAEGTDALIGTSIRSSPITRKIMQSSETLRIIAKYTIGVDDVDVRAATEMGILVTHSPVESNWGGVAEGTIGMILTTLKRSREKDRLVKSGKWREEAVAGVYLGSRDSDGYPGITMGIIGLGRIGARVADLLRPWKMRTLAYDPYIPASHFEEHGVESTDLDTLLRESDVVTLHVVLNEETRHMIGAGQLAKMKPSAVLINTSRGYVVDELALIEALREERIQTAALDVFEEEPVPEDRWKLLAELGDKLLLSPHMVGAASSVTGMMGLGTDMATDSVIDALRGEVPDNIFNKEVIPRWRERFEGRFILP